MEFNVLYANEALFRGGAIEAHANAQPTIRNNTIIGNIGGGIGLVSDSGVIEHNIIIGTVATGTIGDGAIYCVLSDPLVQCNDLWNNEDGDTICGIDGGGNFSADPQFCASDPIASLSFGIQADSPCAPGNSPPCNLIGAGFVECGSVPVRRQTWGGVKNLFRR